MLLKLDFLRQGLITVNPIQDGTFWGCSSIGDGEGPKKPPSKKSVTDVVQR